MAVNPQALQLRFLQTVQEVAAERNSTLVMPVPVELLNFFERMGGGEQAPPGRPARTTPAPQVEPPREAASPYPVDTGRLEAPVAPRDGADGISTEG